MPINLVLNEREKQKNDQKPLTDNANTFCRPTAFMVGKKLEIKVSPSLNRVKDFLLENHGFEISRADPILCKTVLGKNPPRKKAAPLPTSDSKPNPIPNLTLTLPLTPHGGLFSGRNFFLKPCETYGEVAT